MKIGIIGLGHLGTAVLQGLLQGGIPARDILVCEYTDALATAAVLRYGVRATTNADLPCTDCEVVLLAVRKAALVQIAPRMIATKGQALLVSFLAGVTAAEQRALLPGYHIVRAIPSLSAAQGRGVIGIAEDTLPGDRTACQKILPLLGREIYVPETDLEKVTVLGSSGLGFAAYVLDAFSRAGAAMFGNAESAEEIVRSIFTDALRETDFAATHKKVATPGGITERGIAAMERARLEAVFAKALQDALDKAEGR
ncbi:MAG: NAD(P)-binding domain-containing protein [Clostridiales bacterium]|nr:NAD(P)-binding domain-containing protein [Clostridiales bacterium]